MMMEGLDEMIRKKTTGALRCKSSNVEVYRVHSNAAVQF